MASGLQTVAPLSISASIAGVWPLLLKTMLSMPLAADEMPKGPSLHAALRVQRSVGELMQVLLEVGPLCLHLWR